MTLIVTLLILGAVLLFLETLLPGLVTGVIGFLCLVAAVTLGYQEFDVRTGNFILAGVVVGLAVGAFAWLKFFPESRFARRFISKSATGELGVAKPALLHCTGVAITQLRPSGAAVFSGKRVDVVTEGGLIDAGSPVKVMEIEGARVVVREVAPIESDALSRFEGEGGREGPVDSSLDVPLDKGRLAKTGPAHQV